MIKTTPPPIRSFLATPFIAMAEVNAWIATQIMPLPVVVADLNDCVMLEDGESLEDIAREYEDEE